MFERIGSWTELLFPKNLLRDDSVIAHMVKDIPEEDWQDQVQITASDMGVLLYTDFGVVKKREFYAV